MRRLDRLAVPAPNCLARYQHGRHNWDDLSKVPADKEEIRVQLERMQGKRCAYCEGSLDDFGQHIEHFRTRSGHPTLTFVWGNLYWSCMKSECCGVYKDQDAGRYQPNDLVDPCRDDPDHFFRFRSDGSVTFRSGLNAIDRHRAEETLRVFNLDPERGRLPPMREQVAKAYHALDPGIVGAVMACEDEDERRAFIEEELANAAGEPFSAVIRHLFIDLI